MADNFLEYSCLFSIKEEDKARAFDICQEIDDQEDTESGSGLYTNWKLSGGGIWFSSDDGYGEPEAVILRAKALLLELQYADGFVFSWSYSCSHLRIDEFGGGAWAGRVVDGGIEEIYIDAHYDALKWLRDKPQELPESCIRKIRVEE